MYFNHYCCSVSIFLLLEVTFVVNVKKYRCVLIY